MKPTLLILLVGTVVLAGCAGQTPATIEEQASPVDASPLATASKEGEWTVYTISDPAAEASGSIPDQWINEIAVAGNGTVWASTREGLASYDGHAWRTLRDGSESFIAGNWGFDGIAAAPDGSLWLGLTRVLARFDGETWTIFARRDAAKHYIEMGFTTTVVDLPPFGNIIALAVAPNGIVWAATDAGLIRFDGRTSTVFRAGGGLDSDHILALAGAPDGSMWAGSDMGLSRFSGERWASYPKAKLFPTEGSPGIDSLAVANDGTVWTHSADGTILSFDGEHWLEPSPLPKADSDVTWSFEVAPNNAIWVGTSKGLMRLTDGKWDSFPIDEGLLPAQGSVNAPGVMSVAIAQDGTIWCGTERGIASFRPPD